MPATSLAAAFCTCCSLFIFLPGSPVRTPLHESSLDVTNACTSLAQLSWSRCLLILPMFLIACHDDLHMLLICFVSNRFESITTPRFRASGFGGIVHPLMLMSEITSELENLDVKWTISVLSGLHVRPLIMHQIIIPSRNKNPFMKTMESGKGILPV